MIARTRSLTTLGLEAVPVEVEVDSTQGLPAVAIVGLPDQAVKEARQRVRSAIINSEFCLPSRRITINLGPADLKKAGGSFDLAIALGILASSDQLNPARLASAVVVGELALDGSVRAIHGMLPIALTARRHRSQLLIIPAQNAKEACVVGGLPILPVSSLREAAERIAEPIPKLGTRRPTRSHPPSGNQYDVDFSEIQGQKAAKRALEIAVAGSHHVILVGPPGSGKTMLAQRIPTILPDFSRQETLETSTIHSVAGLMNGEPLLKRRPFRSPHHTSSSIALVGGGPDPKPGEISLAHNGVLFLDELPEFRRDVLESLRQPLEEGVVRIARAKRSLSFPARFNLVAAMNPCPCGYLTDSRHRCRCTGPKVQQYLAKVSGPLLDRIDLHIEVPSLPVESLIRPVESETSSKIKERAMRARAIQRRRLAPLGVTCNAQLRHRDLKKICKMSKEAETLFKSALQELCLSARAYDKVLKISRTIADLAASNLIQPDHIAEAIQYRSLDRHLWL